MDYIRYILDCLGSPVHTNPHVSLFVWLFISSLVSISINCGSFSIKELRNI